MTLAILIPTLPRRKHFLDKILQQLHQQIKEGMDIKIFTDFDIKMSIGRKRQVMIEKCRDTGGIDYIAFVDDDDEILEGYIDDIYNAIQSGPDVVGMRGYMTTNGANRENWSVSTKYNDWMENVDGFRYVRCPHHLAPVKLEHALKAGYKDLRWAEDYDYSMRLKEVVLPKEVFIDKEIYHYKFRPNK